MELHEKQKLAKNWVKKKYPHISDQTAEDFSSYYIEVWLTGGGKRDFRWIAIDFFRQHGDRLGARGTGDAMGSLDRRYKTDEETEDPIEQFESQSRRPDESHLLCYRQLNSTLRAVMVLTYEWGFTLKEIGHCLGVSESRVSQMHSEAVQVQTRVLRGELLSEEQRKAARILQEKVYRSLQSVERIQRKPEQAVEKIPIEKRKSLAERKVSSVQKTLLGTFRVTVW